MSAAEKAVAADAASAATAATASTAATAGNAATLDSTTGAAATLDPTASDSDHGASFTPASIVAGAPREAAPRTSPETAVPGASSTAAPASGLEMLGSSPLAAELSKGLPQSEAGSAATERCAGLEYANMKKEEAREHYKDRRRKELLQQGEVDRVKRRKKNDHSISRGEKYSRRLKMNQDSAAAARAAQDAYIKALEGLVETGEEEKSMMDLEAMNLRVEREQLVQRLSVLHHDAEKILLDADRNHVSNLPETVVAEGTDSLRLLQKMQEVYEGDGGTSALTDEAEFARGLMGSMPAPAV